MSLLRKTIAPLLVSGAVIVAGCGAPPAQPSANTAANTANTNTGNSNVNTASTAPTFRELADYQGVISLTLQTIGDEKNTSMPPLNAVVARSGENRAMQFALPTNEKIIYIEKGTQKFVVLPNRQQFAELTEDALGFEVRNMMTPEQIVDQLRRIPGVRAAGEETVGDRTVEKFVYGDARNTGTQAGTVETESYFLIDKDTGLPVRSETVSQSVSGGNVQGVKGLKLVTEMKEIKTIPDPAMFEIPAEYKKIDAEQVKAQANLVFQAAAAVIGQLMKQATVSPTPATPANANTAASGNVNR